MRNKTVLGATSLALVAGVVSLTPVACAGGGGIGLGIATIGVSAVLAGASPGYAIRDPRLSTPVTGAAGVSTTVTPSDPISLDPGESVDRVIVTGGILFNPVTIRAQTEVTTSASLKTELLFSSWDGKIGGQTIASHTENLTAGTNAGTLALDFTSFVVNGQTYTHLVTNPGDQVKVRFTNAGATGPITISASATRIDFVSGQSRQTLFAFKADGPQDFDLNEDFQLTLVSAPGGVENLFLASNVTVVARPGATTIFRALAADATANAVPNWPVTFTADGANAPTVTTVLTGADGVATATFTYPLSADGKRFTVTATARDGFGGTLSDTFDVFVTSTAERQWDGLHSFNVPGPTLSTTNSMSVGQIAEAGGVFAGVAESTLPTGPAAFSYELVENAQSGAFWRFDIQARTRSLLSSAQSTFRIKIFDASGVTLVAQSDPLTATSALQRFAGVMPATTSIVVVLDDTQVSDNIFQVQFEIMSSTDTSTPGIEIITDIGVRSFLYAPGPVVFVTLNGQKVLMSTPDPRQ